MLRTPAPEPPPALLERILFQTSGQTSGAQTSNAQAPLPAAATMVPPQEGVAAMAAYGNVVPFRSRVAAAVRRSPFAQIVLQPRLMMTAAMAFFSIALTMNLTGVHPLSLRASDLQPGSLKRDFYAADARVVRYYEGLRVVYELESRVRDLQTASDTDATAGSTSVQPNPNQPGAQAPVAAPNLNSAPQPGGSQPEHKKPAPRPGTSQREALNQRRRLLAALGSEDDGASVSMRARAERTLA
jgi:hypothetical protein